MTDLAEFLLARIADDDERGRSLVVQWSDVGNSCQSCGTDGTHVLAECEAKRRIVAMHRPYQRIYGQGCDACLHPRRLSPDAPGWPCDTLRPLGLPHANHPDYREEWRP